MSAVLVPKGLSADDYLAWEAAQPERHEYVDGEIFAMVGVRLNHNRITLNAAMLLRDGLRGRPCAVFASDVKLQVRAANAWFYPDVVVTCDERDLSDSDAAAVQHPWLVVEVLSEATAAYDRGKKFEFYRTIATLTHYLLVDATRPSAELFVKNEQGLWVLHPVPPGGTLRIAEPHTLSWPLAALYEGVRWGASGSVDPAGAAGVSAG